MSESFNKILRRWPWANREKIWNRLAESGADSFAGTYFEILNEFEKNPPPKPEQILTDEKEMQIALNFSLLEHSFPLLEHSFPGRSEAFLDRLRYAPDMDAEFAAIFQELSADAEEFQQNFDEIFGGKEKNQKIPGIGRRPKNQDSKILKCFYF